MRVAILLGLCLVAAPALAADKESPDYLRSNHAGSRTLVSNEPVAALFPKLREATAACWAGVVKMGTGLPTPPGGAIGTIQSASRGVAGEISADGRSAYILVRAKGFFGAVQTNFLQIDLDESAGGTQVTVFHKNNVKAQRDFLTEVEHWLDGNLSFCYAKPFMDKRDSG
jgi:hypothetical protein